MSELPPFDHTSTAPVSPISARRVPETARTGRLRQVRMVFAHLPLFLTTLLVLCTGVLLVASFVLGEGRQVSTVVQDQVRGADVAAWRERVREVVVARTTEERSKWAETNVAWATARRDAATGESALAWAEAARLAEGVTGEASDAAVRALVAHADRLVALSAGLDVPVRAGERVASSGTGSTPSAATDTPSTEPTVTQPLITEADPSGAQQSSRINP